MRIKLIAPEVTTNFSGWLKRLVTFPRLSLPIIAAATPPGNEITIEDESFGPLDFNEPADVVGISVMTAAANRAYWIADYYRAKGAKVILGGMHPTFMPSEAMNHADAVVIGEGDLVWPEVIRDIEHGRLRRTYTGAMPDFEKYRPPRRDSFYKTGFLLNTIEASRGCPNSCNFCSISRFHRHPKYKKRSIQSVVKEVESLDGRFLFFVDDNIIGDKGFAKELFRALTPYRIKWFAQLSIDVARDRELLEVLAKSGLVGAYIGFDSMKKANLNDKAKRQNDYVESVSIIRDKGIAIQGSFIFGFDNDDASIFDATLDFLYSTKIELAYFHILTPYPGTAYFDKLTRERRIFAYDWSEYDTKHVVFRPKNMSHEVLQENFSRVWKEFYSMRSLPRILSSNHRLFSAIYNIGTMVKKDGIGASIEHNPTTDSGFLPQPV